jgi:lipopolysaccharide export system protein LptC
MKKEYQSKKLKLVLSALIVLSVGAIVLVFFLYRQFSSEPEKLISAIAGKVDISISKVHHIATKNGRKEWCLDAKTANLVNAAKKAVLEDVVVTFFLKDNSEVYLKADQGILKYRTNDINVNGNVYVTRGPYRLKTESLDYLHQQRKLVSDVPVQISGKTIEMTADAMTFDLESNQTVLLGNVRGILSEKFTL